ncbi:NAD-dependent epimerase/dehydratase family protein [Desertihabitans aurantiacus]|uniref:NAD-dependent epimerase/dehydratase family protein n=1 Tax=Desertihabitans aurantiacus TaxID=2282477 RepID=UPI000DF76F98|nr:NAD-dependent epimerase/dehydratase family protein [Desertihabitans aurantiacus]
MARVVLVTGVSDDFAARCARSLAARPGLEVVGVDLVPPRHPLEDVSFVRADVRSPVLAGLLVSREVDTVVHLAPLVARGGSRRSRAADKESNVIGSMQLFAACQRSPLVRSVVLGSTAEVYAASARNPAAFGEDAGLRGGPRTAFAQDCLEIESYARSLPQRRPDVSVTVLRLGPLLGAGVSSQLTRWLSGPVVPKAAGFDARLQFLHPADAAHAVTRAVTHPEPGVYNVAAPDVVMLSQLLTWLGRPAWPVPRPALAAMRRPAARAELTVPDDVDGITYGRVLDVRRVAEALQVRSHWTSRSAAEEFIALTSPGVRSRVVSVAQRRLGAGRA